MKHYRYVAADGSSMGTASVMLHQRDSIGDRRLHQPAKISDGQPPVRASMRIAVKPEYLAGVSLGFAIWAAQTSRSMFDLGSPSRWPLCRCSSGTSGYISLRCCCCVLPWSWVPHLSVCFKFRRPFPWSSPWLLASGADTRDGGHVWRKSLTGWFAARLTFHVRSASPTEFMADSP